MSNENWSLNLNLAGRKVFVPGEGMDRVPTGAYSVIIEKTWQQEKKGGDGADNVVFALKITERGAEGKKLRIYLPTDPEVGDGIVGDKWFTIASTVARDPAVLQKGAVKHTAALYNGKPAFVHVLDTTERDAKGRLALQNVTFIDKANYDKFKADAGTAGAAASGGAMKVTGGAPEGAGAQTQTQTPQAADAIALD